MTIVSSEPIVLIGPGSEWFWSAAQLVVVAITLIGIYFQLRLQRAANAFAQLHGLMAEWNSERLVRARLGVARAAKAGEAPPVAAVSLIGNYFEEVASLVRAGHIDVSIVYENMGGLLRFWWMVLHEDVQGERERQGPMTLTHFERLAGLFEARARQEEHPFPIDRALIMRELPDLVTQNEEHLRMLEESRGLPTPRQSTAREKPPAKRRQRSSCDVPRNRD